MYSLIRKALFLTDPETAHGLALESLRLGYGVGATGILFGQEEKVSVKPTYSRISSLH